MATNTAIIEKFYQAFQRKDPEGMIECYHPDIEFSDPAFGTLKGVQVAKMWKVLCKNGKDLRVEYSDITTHDNCGTVHWEAFYTFSTTGRKIHNKIEAEFHFLDGKIIRHQDSFNLRKWAGMAFGLKGWLLGGTPFFRKKLQERTRKMLKE